MSAVLSIVVARAENGAIGVENTLPWRLSNDLQYFKRVTMGKPIIMGRKTFDSIGRPLPGRTNIVVTRNKDWRHDGVSVAHSLDEAVSLAGREQTDEVMLIGGAELYRQGLAAAQRVYLTEVKTSVQGDAFFPELDPADWRETSRDSHPADEKNQYPHDFVVFERS
ncbi:dihydrofolate reductase [Hahella sp. KA22]|uniref:dihydrofolate reductase n=1 Tax=Hahella sp. KA22 TaxID=1628392 RepID=UPI000FDD28AF|nr:dihydrofolate reductase [Hahella sp. KA22]AZZ90521.1 dihydrofolate reductase [Hahella sp. KA22]QAY53891.1 dihydrofolate reductase [Hahella sp. KA22]